MTDKTKIALDYWANHSAQVSAKDYADIIEDAITSEMTGNANLLIGRGYNLAKYHNIPEPVEKKAKKAKRDDVENTPE